MCRRQPREVGREGLTRVLGEEVRRVGLVREVGRELKRVTGHFCVDAFR